MTSANNLESRIVETSLTELVEQRYLSYALSTIMSRSLPDVRDGLKPVHRRLLFAMRQLNLNADGMPKKSARVVGDVIGRYHPHGDASVYDALVRLAQDFAMRYPLAYGQGNFGNIDGDNAAAMRYTEAKLTKVAELMLDGLRDDTVDFRATYDGDGEEPIVLPSAFPNLLANGATGIAVGMATNIPPHNIRELCDGLIALIDNPEITTAQLVKKHIKGPDFPTGGVIVEDQASLIKTYETGKGAIRLRAKWEREELGQGMYQIVVTEIPYQVQKAQLVEKIADLVHEKKLPLLDNLRDESAEDVRLVLIPKSRNVEPEVLMATLYRHTDLETRFNLNMNALDEGVTPRVMPLHDVLNAYLMHRHTVLVRRIQHRLSVIEKRLELLAGYLIAYLNIDEVIRIIREEDAPKQELMTRFKLSDRQAEAVLNMRLRNLRKLEEMEIRTEQNQLEDERAGLIDLLEHDSKRWVKIREEVVDLKAIFTPEGRKKPSTLEHQMGERRSNFGEAGTVTEVPLEAMIEREPLTVVMSAKGWIRAMKGHIKDTGDIRYKDGDSEGFVLQAYTTDKINIISSMGRSFTLDCHELPAGRGFGEPVRVMLGISDDAALMSVVIHDPEARFLAVASDGRGFQIKGEDIAASTRNGKQIMTIPKGGAMSHLLPINEGDDHIAIVGTHRKLLVFPLADVPELSKGRGVILQKYKDARVGDATTLRLDDGLSWSMGKLNRSVDDLRPWLGKRAQVGKMPPYGFPRDNKFTGA